VPKSRAIKLGGAPPSLPIPPPAPMLRVRCRATTRHTSLWVLATVGVQCKFDCDHEGDHAGPIPGGGDHFWPNEA
jgi:hypothetical protein